MALQSFTVLHRIPIEIERDTKQLETALHQLSRCKPTGSVNLLSPFGFSFRKEPQIFAFVTTGFSLGAGLLLTEFSFHVHHASYVALALATVFYLLAMLCVFVFLRTYFMHIEILTLNSEFVYRIRIGNRITKTFHIHADAIVAVLVIQLEAGSSPRVVLAGPRHAMLGELYRSRMLDPDRFAPWFAEMVALVAKRASVPNS